MPGTAFLSWSGCRRGVLGVRVIDDKDRVITARVGRRLLPGPGAPRSNLHFLGGRGSARLRRGGGSPGGRLQEGHFGGGHQVAHTFLLRVRLLSSPPGSAGLFPLPLVVLPAPRHGILQALPLFLDPLLLKMHNIPERLTQFVVNLRVSA